VILEKEVFQKKIALEAEKRGREKTQRKEAEKRPYHGLTPLAVIRKSSFPSELCSAFVGAQRSGSPRNAAL